MAQSVGIDFGTSNSAVASADGSGVRVAQFHQLDAMTQTDTMRLTAPTVMFFPSYEKGTYYGGNAVDHYLFRGWEGRFIQSIKAVLPVDSFKGTEIRGRFTTIEDLIALYLRWLMDAARKSLGPLDGPIVLGRPAKFAADPTADALAESRLRTAAAKAGLKDIQFLIEPVAAALSYEATLTRDEHVFVADLGGGTSDFTVMRVGPGERNQRDRQGSILASGGLSVAGDAMDGEIVRNRLFDRLGYGSSYLAFTDEAKIPNWIFLKLLRWNHVSFLKTKKNLAFLEQAVVNSDHPKELGALLEIVQSDMGYLLFRAVERAKVQSAQGPAMIEDEEHGLPVRAELTPEHLRSATQKNVEEIRDTALNVLRDSGLGPGDIDAVFLTGGTSLLPPIRMAFQELFGAQKISERDTFTSVAAGLAHHAALL